jgi:preprotein translocase subunit SecA
LQPLSNDELRNKTQEFRARIQDHLSDIDRQIADKKAEADTENAEDIQAREVIYNEVDKLIKKRDEQIEEILNIILPEAFAVIKETARRFKESKEIVATATSV